MMQTAEIETARPVIRIVDDDEVFLASQKFFFETFFPEVRVWPCAERFLDEEDLSAPGCLILDYRMPDRSGLEVQRALLLRRKPMLPIIFFERPWRYRHRRTCHEERCGRLSGKTR